MNRNYFKYLLKERKLVLIFFFVLYLAIPMSVFIMLSNSSRLADSVLIAFLINLCLTYALPVLSFAFVHRRRSADLYFSLPVSRTQQLVTILVFCIAVPIVFFTTAVLLCLIASHAWAMAGQVLIMILYAAVIMAEMTVINSSMYLLANNLFDGIIMVCAYTFLPALIYLIFSMFISNMVAGANLSTYTSLPAAVTSPLWMNGVTFIDLLDVLHGNAFRARSLYIIMPAVYALVSLLLLKIHFIDRKSERAEQVSDDILAYPAAIHLCLFLVMTAISVYVVRFSFRDSIIWYLILLFIYIVSMFVYRRSLKVEPRSLAIYGIIAAVCFGITRTAWATEGFSLARNYSLTNGQFLNYSYYVYNAAEDLGEYMIPEKAEYEETRTVSFTLHIPVDEMEKYREVIDLMENTRNRCITMYYDRGHDTFRGGSLHVYNETEKEGMTGLYMSEDSVYFYEVMKEDMLSEDQLRIVSRYTPVEVSYFDGQEYISVSLETYLKER